MEVNKYIHELLYQYDCVILPDFGGFIANYQPAEINLQSNLFSPPSKTIEFNRNLKHNDGLLVNYVSKSEGIEYISSKKKVIGFVGETMKRLKKGEKIEFEGIGIFSLTQQNHLKFEADKEANFLLDSYGLSTFRFQPVEYFDLERRLHVAFKNNQPVHQIPFRKIIIGTAAVIALLIIPVRNNFFSNSNKNLMTLSPFNNSKKLSTNTFTVKTEAISAKTFDSTTVTTKQPEEIKTETKLSSVKTSQKTYFVIVGSSITFDIAKKYQLELSNKGITSSILEKRDKRFRLSAFNSNQKSESDSFLLKIREKIPDAWILVE